MLFSLLGSKHAELEVEFAEFAVEFVVEIVEMEVVDVILSRKGSWRL